MPAKPTSGPSCPHTPLVKLRRNLAALQRGADVQAVVLLATGAVNPPHLQHVAMFNIAKAHLERAAPPAEGGARVVVVAGFLSPSHDGYVGGKLGADAIAARDRVEMCRLATADSSFVDVDAWESLGNDDFVDFPCVASRLQAHLDSDEVGLGEPGAVQVMYLCGTDHVNKCGLFGGTSVPVVAMARAGEDPLYRAPDPRRCFVVDAGEHEASDASSTEVRRRIRGREPLAGLLAPAVEAFVYEHGILGAKKGKEALPRVFAPRVAAAIAELAAGAEMVDLDSADVGDKGLAAVADALAGNWTCKRLHLDDNKITDEGLSRLAEMLRGNTTLTTLSLKYNKITDEGLSRLAEMLRGNTTLTDLFLFGNPVLDDAAEQAVLAIVEQNEEDPAAAAARAAAAGAAAAAAPAAGKASRPTQPLPTTGTQVERDDWFSHLFGFAEQGDEADPYAPVDMAAVRARFELCGGGGSGASGGATLRSKVNGASYGVGRFSTPSLAELRARAAALGVLAPHGSAATTAATTRTATTLEHFATSDIFAQHSDPAFRGATFLAASQFNCLEFAHPGATPEDGVTGYVHDGTQGPACALACAPGTVYRNYFAGVCGVPVPSSSAHGARGREGSAAGQGQSADRQINNLAGVLSAITGRGGGSGAGGGKDEDEDEELVSVRNGYTSSDDARLARLNARLHELGAEGRAAAGAQLRIGLHAAVEVPWVWRAPRFVLAPPEERQAVTQSYCSALACGYSAGDIEAWAPLATLVLDASYEATLLAAAIEAAEGRGSGQVVLCGLGGGVFGNRSEWIEGAIVRAIGACATAGLRVSFAHHGRVDEDFAARVDSAIAADSRRRQASLAS